MNQFLFTFEQFSKKHQAFSISSLRWIRFNSNIRKSSKGVVAKNGMADAFVKLGNRVYINEPVFFKLICPTTINEYSESV